MSRREEEVRRSAPRWVRSFVAGALLLIYFPMVTLILLSFRAPARDGGGWTLRWYRQLWENAEVIDACWLSLRVAFLCAATASVLGTLAAYAIVRYRWPGSGLFRVFTHLPLIMPEIVLGLALLVWFVALRFSLGVFSVVVAHVTFSVSYVIISVSTRLQELDPQLEEAARDLGASSWQTFRRVTLPLILPATVSGSILAFTLSFDDFLITYFVSGAGVETLPLKIYSMIRFGISPEINALSTLLLLFTFTAVVIGTRLGGASRWR